MSEYALPDFDTVLIMNPAPENSPASDTESIAIVTDSNTVTGIYMATEAYYNNPDRYAKDVEMTCVMEWSDQPTKEENNYGFTITFSHLQGNVDGKLVRFSWIEPEKGKVDLEFVADDGDSAELDFNLKTKGGKIYIEGELNGRLKWNCFIAVHVEFPEKTITYKLQDCSGREGTVEKLYGTFFLFRCSSDEIYGKVGDSWPNDLVANGPTNERYRLRR